MIHTRVLDCGLTVLVEPITSVESCSIHWLTPAGTAYDPVERMGISTILSEMLLRGAGGRDSRQLSEDMDRIGLERDSGISQRHAWLVGSALGKHLETSLALFTDVIRAAELPEASLGACQSLAEQSIESLEDEPQHEVMLHVRRRHNRAPFNRSNYGYLDVIQNLSMQEVRSAWQQGFVPGGSLLGLAGNVDPDAVIRRLEGLLAGWSGSRKEPEAIEDAKGAKGISCVNQLNFILEWAGQDRDLNMRIPFLNVWQSESLGILQWATVHRSSTKAILVLQRQCCLSRPSRRRGCVSLRRHHARTGCRDPGNL